MAAETPPLSPEQIEQLSRVLGDQAARLIASVANSDVPQSVTNLADAAPPALRALVNVSLGPKSSERQRRRAKAALVKWLRRQAG